MAEPGTKPRGKRASGGNGTSGGWACQADFELQPVGVFAGRGRPWSVPRKAHGRVADREIIEDDQGGGPAIVEMRLVPGGRTANRASQLDLRRKSSKVPYTWNGKDLPAIFREAGCSGGVNVAHNCGLSGRPRRGTTPGGVSSFKNSRSRRTPRPLILVPPFAFPVSPQRPAPRTRSLPQREVGETAGAIHAPAAVDPSRNGRRPRRSLGT